MNITLIPISEIKPFENNPRYNEDAVPAVAESIRQFGFKQPIVVDKNNTIVCGHTRYKAAQQLGLTDIPCLIADDLTPEQIKAYRLVDNRTAEFAKWDFALLSNEIKELVDVGFDIKDLGWDAGAIDAFIGTPTEQAGLPDTQDNKLDEGAGKFILAYKDDAEKRIWCEALGIEGDKVVYYVGDLKIDAEFDPSEE
jgi:ParB family chromosome partitioning protein